jgi:hypothetical protein
MSLFEKSILVIACVIFVRCQTSTNKASSSVKTITLSDSSKNHSELLGKLEQQSAGINYDSLGEIISRISYGIKTNDLANFEDGKIPWIRIDSPQTEIQNLIGKDETVITQSKVTIFVDYPLTNTYIFELTSPKGFTRTQLIYEISKQYYQLYDEEERTATIKTLPLEQRTIYNRNKTDGKYGIWGHDIGDLVLAEIIVYKTSNGIIFLTLEIES